MADIAILVAEEYERRVKNLSKIGDGIEGNQGNHMVSSYVLEMGQRLTNKIRGQKTELVKLVLEPKNQISIAASTSFFSA
ncbi:Ubiquitin-activating enzyme like [Quillaja saponaria]|uniref:Ubiquitin-activating enzyme like n=1 Tax=Quillaja saponaria TaxID=32244 RepID=A0AAD7LGC9_QUISA|nr:Ubiquitin-activating enzyme like [Quillaja saponaria]